MAQACRSPPSRGMMTCQGRCTPRLNAAVSPREAVHIICFEMISIGHVDIGVAENYRSFLRSIEHHVERPGSEGVVRADAARS